MDAISKYNIIPQTTTGCPPHFLWHKKQLRNMPLFVFGEVGTTHVHETHLKKLQPRSAAVRYLYGSPDGYITVETISLSGNTRTKVRRIRAEDFKPYDGALDPCYTALRTTARHHDPVTTQITRDTPAPANLHQARRYPDAYIPGGWQESHDAELDQLDRLEAIRYMPTDQLPTNSKPISLVMTYKYKRDLFGETLKRKSRSSVNGKHMKPNVHFDPLDTTTYMADRSTVRMGLSSIPAHNRKVAKFDIVCAYVSEKWKSKVPVVIKQIQRFDGT